MMADTDWPADLAEREAICDGHAIEHSADLPVIAGVAPSADSIADSIAALTSVLESLRTRMVAAGKINEDALVGLHLWAGGTGIITAGSKQSFGAPGTLLGEAFAAAEASITAPSFRPGELVVQRSAPERGHAVVIACRPYPDGRSWRLECRAGLSTVHIDSGVYVAMPPGWRDPPIRSIGAVERLELSYDGAIPAAELAAARIADDEQAAERAEWLRAMALWWSECGALVDPVRARREAEGLRGIAETISAKPRRTVA